MARTRTPQRPPEEDAPALANPPEPDGERTVTIDGPPQGPPKPRISIASYVHEARLSALHAAVLTALHPTTKATRDEWAQHLTRALARRVP